MIPRAQKSCQFIRTFLGILYPKSKIGNRISPQDTLRGQVVSRSRRIRAIYTIAFPSSSPLWRKILYAYSYHGSVRHQLIKGCLIARTHTGAGEEQPRRSGSTRGRFWMFSALVMRQSDPFMKVRVGHRFDIRKRDKIVTWWVPAEWRFRGERVGRAAGDCFQACAGEAMIVGVKGNGGPNIRTRIRASMVYLKYPNADQASTASNLEISEQNQTLTLNLSELGSNLTPD